MTTIEIDLSQVAQARDIHVAFSTALGFPEWYGHNWDAFWDLVSSDYPLPDHLTLRGLDHVERVLPAEATKMLACFADYNNSSGRVCELAITDDYASPMFLLRYEATPVAPIEDAEGAFVNCWIKAASSREANEVAVKLIEDEGWRVISHEATEATSLASATEDTRPFVAQACVDGAVLDFHTWSSEADSDEDDSDEEPMTIDCKVHGTSRSAIVCRHHVHPTDTALGFVENSSDPDDLQAWCDACEEMFLSEGDKTEAFLKFNHFAVVCVACYERLKQLHSAPN
jgi:RNAse (barnase) inhibitor barstar